MAAKDTISVRLDADLNDRISRMAIKKGMSYSDALRYALNFGMDRIERGHDVLDASRFMDYTGVSGTGRKNHHRVRSGAVLLASEM